ncbi:MAG TPA: GGDEF domain-containing protein [Treponemataceae bacterium]|nr:GGDEF domain-containing protein [Treponemataceae bacterium]
MNRLRFAVLLDNTFSYFQEEPYLGITRYTGENNIDAVFFGMGYFNPKYAENKAKEIFFEMINKDEFDGIIIISTSLLNSGGGSILKSHLEKLSTIPMVSIGPSVCGEDSFCLDNATGMRSIMQHLINYHGYKKFAYVSGPISNNEAKSRLDTYREELAKADIPVNEKHEYMGHFITPSGEQALDYFLDEIKYKPEVIVCANDLMALGIWNNMKRRGLSIPYDIALTGYDDSRLHNLLQNQFTTVRQSFDDLGYAAAKRLHENIQGIKGQTIKPFSAEIRIKSSCGCVDYYQRFEKQKTDDQENNISKVVYPKLETTLNNLETDILKAADNYEVFKIWADYIHEVLSKNYPVNRLEEKIIDLISDDKTASDKLHPVLPALHSLLLEESEQQVFASLQLQTMYQDYVRMALDHLQNEILQDLDLKNHEQSFIRLMKDAGSSSFHVISFLNSSSPLDSAQLIFSSNNDGSSWKPGNKSWFPPRGKSYVVNLIGLDEERSGYFIIESGLIHPKVYDTLRVRLSSTVKDMMIMRSIKELNTNLLSEIQAREETEQQLKEALSLVEKISIRDELTQLYNRRGFFEAAQKHIKFLKRHNVGFFLLYIDLDGLKKINDVYGHQDGDLAIKETAEILRGALRETDIIARLGGDEFTVVISKVEPPNYECIFNRIEQKRIEKNKELNKPWQIEMSIGNIYVSAEDEQDLTELMNKADTMLYKEKHSKKKAQK